MPYMHPQKKNGNAVFALKFDLESAYALEPGNESEEKWRQWSKESLAAVKRISSVLERNDAPATFFIVGKVLERAGQDFASVLKNPVYDIESHTYSHMVINRADPAVLDQFDWELRKTAELIERYFGARPHGFCAPGGFYRGLRDCPKQLEILWEQGYTFVNTDGEGPSGQPMPAPFTQPYWYSEEGFPDILEIPVTGWHCNMLFNSGHQSDGYRPAPGFPDGTILEKLPATVDEGFYARAKEFQFAIAII